MYNKVVKYDVYENDLKFPEYIDPDKSIWQNDEVKRKFFSKEVTTLTYRLNECKKNFYEYLDLSYLKLKEIPDFTERVDYKNIKNIKYLFINNNLIENIDNSLQQFKKLEVLDISSNKLKKIKNIPHSLKELVCHNNKLIAICSSDNLVTLDCSFNKMIKLNEYVSILNLMCENNLIEELQTFVNVKHLTLKNNPLKKLSMQPNLEFLNIENTNLISELPEMPKLKWLICHKTKITNINKLINLVHIEMTQCSLTQIPYLKFLQDILCDLENNLQIDERLKLKTYLIEKEHVYYIFDTKN